MAVDEDSLICDFAETYHILDYRGLRPSLAATLCFGLRDDSRVKMTIAGLKASPDTFLLASAVDRLSLLVWSKTKDAEYGWNRPESIVESIMGKGKQNNNDFEVYDSAESFEAARRKIVEDIANGN